MDQCLKVLKVQCVFELSPALNLLERSQFSSAQEHYLLHVRNSITQQPQAYLLSLPLASVDFVPRTRVPVTFSAGDSEEFVDVQIINDAVHEGEEDFEAFLELQPGSSGAVIGQQSTATATIQDDDGTIHYIRSLILCITVYTYLIRTVVTVGFNPTTYSEEEGQIVTFTVEILEGQTQTDVLVNFGTSDVSAAGNKKLRFL